MQSGPLPSLAESGRDNAKGAGHTDLLPVVQRFLFVCVRWACNPGGPSPTPQHRNAAHSPRTLVGPQRHLHRTPTFAHGAAASAQPNPPPPQSPKCFSLLILYQTKNAKPFALRAVRKSSPPPPQAFDPQEVFMGFRRLRFQFFGYAEGGVPMTRDVRRCQVMPTFGLRVFSLLYDG